ncbi:hypothetical protein [Paenibacillus sp. CMAA1364]
MKQRIVILMVSLLLILMVIPTTTSALSCVEKPTVEQGYEKYDAVIIGYVEDVIRKRDHNQIRLNVMKSFKGVDKQHIVVKEDITWGSLSGPSEIGVEYLYYLTGQEKDWENPLCSPTTNMTDATQDLEFLKGKEIPIETTSQLNWMIIMGIGLLGILVIAIWQFRSNQRNKSN